MEPNEMIDAFQQLITESVVDLTERERGLAHLLAKFDAADWERMIAGLKDVPGVMVHLVGQYALVLAYKRGQDTLPTPSGLDSETQAAIERTG